MKRIVLMLALAAMVVVALAATAPSSFAKQCETEPGPPFGHRTTVCGGGENGTFMETNGRNGQHVADAGTCKRTGSDQTNTCPTV